jgi:rhamnopyranosyl-N-acetylglucosaminyl-diphospho-decaprenol beta-1,3/1,4-galactofuranosyltransferase
MNQAKIFAAVVTFNRKKQLRVCLEKLLAQTRKPDQICIIDNASTDGTFDFIRDLTQTDKNIIYCNTGCNMGGSGGFHLAFEKFLESDADFIWGMDDDAFPEPDALEKLIEFQTRCTRRACTVCLAIPYEKDKEEYLNACVPPATRAEELTFVGFLLPRSLVETIGLPMKNLFIYYDDINYSERIIQAGYEIYIVRDAVIHHTFWKNLLSKTVAGRTFQIPDLSGWKWYYYMRNGLLIYPRHHAKRKNLLKWNMKMLLSVILIRPRYAGTALKGIVDGLRGIDGKRKQKKHTRSN